MQRVLAWLFAVPRRMRLLDSQNEALRLEVEARKRAQGELREAMAQLASRERRLDLATEVAGLGIFVWDRGQDRITSETLRNFQIFGRTPDDPPLALEDFVRRFVHYEDREPFREHVRNSLTTGEPLHAICRIQRQNDQAWRWLEIAGTFEPKTDGVPDRLIGVLSDITERKQREREIQDRNEMLRLAMRAGRMGAWVYHFADEAVEWSHEFEELFGLKPGAFRHSNGPFLERVHAEDRELLAARTRRALAERSDYTVEFRFRHASGEWRWMEARGRAVYDESGKPVSLYGIGMDITDRRRADDALREADRRKDEFLAILAHELRNPLAPIRNAVQFMHSKEASEAALRNARDIVDRQVRHMVRLVDDLLEVSRITSGRIELDRERVSLDIIVQNAVEASQPLIQAGEHQLEVHLPATPVYIEADITRLSQVLLNLLNNAAKYTPPRGRISLSAQASESDVAVSVRDNGVGIPPAQLAHIFELFVQLGRSAGIGRSGLGIGLTLARQLTRLHGGDLEASSAGPGLGSEFIVRLPLAPAPAPEVSPSDTQRQRRFAPQRILLVDDNVDAAEALSLNLREAGHDVRTVHDGARAIRAFGEEPREVVVLDLGLPDISGIEVARALRSTRAGRNAVLVALTGWGREEDRTRTREAGFDEHLTKPVDALVLLQVIAMHRRDTQVHVR